jgi:glycine/D-amino acid oxidase-like deaminating enzyme
MAAPDGVAGSLWEATAVESPALSSLAGDAKAEICVIGAGFTGLSTALHLAEIGRDVVVLDRYWPGYGASGRNGGQILPGLKWLPGELVEKLGERAGSRLADFTARTPDIVYAMLERHGIRCGLRPKCGWVNAAATEAAATSLRKRADQFRGLGFPVRFAESDEVARLLGTPRYSGALIDDRAGAINPLSLARELARVAKSYGARIHVTSPAIRLTRAGDRWRIETPGGAVTAQKVLLATNAYTDELWPHLRQEVIPVNSLQVATKPLPTALRATILPENHVISDTQRLLLYFRYDDAGRLIMGGRGSFGQHNRETLYRFIEDAALRLFPQLKGTAWEFRWSGKVALTADQLPRVHELAPGVVTCLGYNGRGVALSNAIGQVLASWLTTGDPDASPIPVTPLRPIPFHGFRRPVLELIGAWSRLRDVIG